MPLVPAKCTSCGATLNVDSTKDACICEYCGQAFIVSKAISNYNITNNVTNYIHANVVNIQGSPEDDFEIVAGTLKKYKGASTEVIIPRTVVDIDGEAFWGCYNLRKADIPGTVKTVRSFMGCSSLTSVTFHEGTQYIGKYCFKGCKALSSISLPDSLETIGDAAFADCSALSSVELGMRLVKIGNGAFSGCDSLSKITVRGCSDNRDDCFVFPPHMNIFSAGVFTRVPGKVVFLHTGSLESAFEMKYVFNHDTLQSKRWFDKKVGPFFSTIDKQQHVFVIHKGKKYPDVRYTTHHEYVFDDNTDKRDSSDSFAESELDEVFGCKVIPFDDRSDEQKQIDYEKEKQEKESREKRREEYQKKYPDRKLVFYTDTAAVIWIFAALGVIISLVGFGFIGQVGFGNTLLMMLLFGIAGLGIGAVINLIIFIIRKIINR